MQQYLLDATDACQKSLIAIKDLTRLQLQQIFQGPNIPSTNPTYPSQVQQIQ